MGASLKQPPGSSKRAKKELLLKDIRLSGSTATSAAMEMTAESHSMMAAHHRRIACSSVAQQTRIPQIKDQIVAALQIEFTMHQGVGDLDAARLCISQMQHLRTQLAAITITATASSFTEEDPPFDKVDLTNVEDNDKEAQQDVEEMYT
jgi:hypothetical protein